MQALLPNELWLEILLTALRPNGCIDGVFEPKEIDQVVRAASMSGNNRDEEKKLLVRQRTNLKLVCHLWNKLIDALPANSWTIELVVAESIDNWTVQTRNEDNSSSLRNLSSFFADTESARPPMVETNGFEKVNLTYRTHFEAEMRLVYTQPVLNLTVTMPTYGTNPTSLSHILSYPEELRFLHLGMDSENNTPKLLSYLETYTPHLTTLSLNTSTLHVLPQTLSIPSLQTLFLALQPGFHSGEYEWTFPVLRHFSFDGHGYTDDISAVVFHPLPGLCKSIIEKHSGILTSLRVNPPYVEIINNFTSYGWADMPNLDTFATNFSGHSLVTIPIMTKPQNDSTCLRHLIQISGMPFRLDKSVRGLIKCIEICKTPGSIQDIYAVCQQRNLKLLNLDGQEVYLPFDEDASKV